MPQLIHTELESQRIFITDTLFISALVQATKDEIATPCPKAVTDGCRVFRVRWIDYEHAHVVKVLVDCRSRNSPMGEKYFKAKQGVLEEC